MRTTILFRGKKTRKAEKKLVTRQFNIFYKRCSEKKRKLEKNARAQNETQLQTTFRIKNAALPKKWVKKANEPSMKGCKDALMILTAMRRKKTTATTTISCPKKVCNSRPSASSFEYLALRIFSRFFASSFFCRLSLQGLRYEGRPRQPWVTTISRQASKKEGRKEDTAS